VIRIVVDTSVLIRYLIRSSAAIKKLIENLWLDEEVQLVTSPELIEELEGVLARDYIQALIRPEEGQTLLDTIRLKGEFSPPLGTIPSYTRDPKDDKFIACALAGNAEYVITVDKDILALGTLSDIRMVPPREFVAIVESEK
jgi:putative PIN family toxin of toxin-antitoxin system